MKMCRTPGNTLHLTLRRSWAQKADKRLASVSEAHPGDTIAGVFTTSSEH
jgi:hypothetical protein